MKFVEVRFQNGQTLWFAIPAGMTREQAIDFFFTPGTFAGEEALGNVASVGSPVDAVPEGQTLQPTHPGLDFGGGGAGGSGDDGEELPFDFEGAFPGGAFQRGLTERTGRTGQPTNILQRILQGESGQTQSAFRGNVIADLLGGTGLGEVAQRSFQDFTAGTGRAARSNLAQDIFRRIGASRGNVEAFLGNEALGSAPGEFLRPTSTGAAGDAINLLRDALRGAINPLIVGSLPNNQQLFEQFRADPNVGFAPTGGNNIIDFLRKRFGTSRLGF